MTYSAEITEQAESHPTLGAEYFAARDATEGFLAHWKEEHAFNISEEIVKPLLEVIQERVNDAFQNYLLSDAEQNVQSTMRRMVEDSVKALIGGDKWPSHKYIETPYGDGQKIRETLAKLHSDPIKDGRISDLEKQVERLTKDLSFYRDRH